MSNDQVDVTVTNNSGQTTTLRFPAESEMPAYLKSLARREDLAAVEISAPFDGADESAAGKPAKAKPTTRKPAAKREAKPDASPIGDDAGAGDSGA